MKMSLPKKKQKKKKFFFRETPTSPWVPFRAKFRPLGRLFRPIRPLAWSLINISKQCQTYLQSTSWLLAILKAQLIINRFFISSQGHSTGFLKKYREGPSTLLKEQFCPLCKISWWLEITSKLSESNQFNLDPQLLRKMSTLQYMFIFFVISHLSYAVTFIQWISLVINNITTWNITLSAGTSNVITMSVTTLQIFIETNKVWRR